MILETTATKEELAREIRVLRAQRDDLEEMLASYRRVCTKYYIPDPATLDKFCAECLRQLQEYDTGIKEVRVELTEMQGELREIEKEVGGEAYPFKPSGRCHYCGAGQPPPPPEPLFDPYKPCEYCGGNH